MSASPASHIAFSARNSHSFTPFTLSLPPPSRPLCVGPQPSPRPDLYGVYLEEVHHHHHSIAHSCQISPLPQWWDDTTVELLRGVCLARMLLLIARVLLVLPALLPATCIATAAISSCVVACGAVSRLVPALTLFMLLDCFLSMCFCSLLCAVQSY